MGSPHALMLPYPYQGHIIPLMELSHCLVEQGFEITFVNNEFNHERIVTTLRSSEKGGDLGRIHLVSIPDGLGPDEDRRHLGRLTDGLLRAMPAALEELIRKSDESRGKKITCMIADGNMAWAFPVAKKLGLRAVAFWPASAAMLATMISIPKLIEDGILHSHGLPRRHESFQLSPGMPVMNTDQFGWNCAGSAPGTQQIIFQFVVNNNRAIEIAEFIICNSFHEIESQALTFNSRLFPVGPLLGGLAPGKPLGNFWPEDTSCMSWLDEQPANSVIYIAFGSLTIFEQHQFQELALGLELSGRPFLWVVRPDLTDEISEVYPDGFRDRVSKRGRIVGWAPQREVLAHPSIACFLSHCGWNSTLEGLWNGVPFLCWPYFTDQFLNQSYICDLWKIGFRLIPGKSGIISRGEISAKVEEVLADGEIRSRVLDWKNMARRSVSEGGSSFQNFKTFVDAMKE